MIPPALDRAVLSAGLAQIAQLISTYDSKTDQTDKRIEIAEQFGAPPCQKLTSRHPKLTSGPAQQPNPCGQAVGAPLDSTHARPSDGAPQP
jgi:Flp pilus assembly protein TadG